MSVMSFLAGLDPQFEAAKSQILSSTEVPSLNEVYSRPLCTSTASSIVLCQALVCFLVIMVVQQDLTVRTKEMITALGILEDEGR